MRSRATAIILAAGASSRMGRPKALIPHDGVPWVAHLAHTLKRAGCDVVVVWGAHRDVAAATPSFARAVEAPDWRAGMRASLRAGVRAAPGPYLITPVDCPFVSVQTVRAMMATRGACAPTYCGRPGHPLRVPASARARLLADDAVPLRHCVRPSRLAVSDPEVLRNLNRPADIQSLTR